MEKLQKINLIVRDLVILLLNYQLLVKANLSLHSKTSAEVSLGIWGILFLMDLFLLKEKEDTEN